MTKKNLLGFLLFFLLTVSVTFSFVIFLSQEKSIEGPETSSSVSSEYNEKWLTHRLIKMDNDNGISSSIARKAWGNTGHFIHSVKEKCQSATTTHDFLYCANGMLGDLFPYKKSDMVSPAYANHVSDCDLNVYLLIDAAKEAGRHIDIVFAPFHAFVSFIDENNARAYWETTDNKNKGAVADLNDNQWYQKTFNSFYYSPQGEDYIESLYPVFIAKYVNPPHKEKIYNALAEHIKSTPLACDLYYSMKGEITHQDAGQIAILLREDITSLQKHLILSEYFIKNHNISSAKEYLNKIQSKNCNLNCIEFKKQVYWRFLPSYIVAKTAARFDASLSLEDIYYYYAFNFVILLSGFILFFSDSRKQNKKRSADNK